MKISLMGAREFISKIPHYLSKLRWILTTAILLVVLAMPFIGGRFYPFSDFPMFAYYRTNLRSYVLACEREDQSYRVLWQREHRPFMRLWINQIIIFNLRRGNGLSWVKTIADDLKASGSTCRALVVFEAAFERSENNSLVVNWTQSKMLHREDISGE